MATATRSPQQRRSSGTSKGLPNNRVSQRHLLVGISALVVGLVAAIVGLSLTRAHNVTPAAGPISRQVMVYQQSIIKTNKPAPTLAALQYAYLASVYAGVLQKTNQSEALAAAQTMLVTMYPDKRTDIDQHLAAIATTNHVQLATKTTQSSIVHDYVTRYANDAHNLPWDGVIPTGDGKWVKKTATNPLTPRAGDWQRWNVTEPITVPEPPVFGSAEDAAQQAIVRQAVATRNGQDVNIINFWAGRPGSEGPSGIWQNQLFTTVQPALSTDAKTADVRYAIVQKDLAQTVSDAFMECWKVKYTYWTARPDMRMPDLGVAMDDPVFPSYVSGHSTISKAAADVLSALLPEDKAAWQAMAVEARDSRLKAGIHFQIDNTVGFQVGTNVATQTVTKLQLTKVNL